MAVHIDPLLWSVIVCPADQAELTAGTPTDPEADVLSCQGCGRQYPVRDGIPVLLLVEAVGPESP